MERYGRGLVMAAFTLYTCSLVMSGCASTSSRTWNAATMPPAAQARGVAHGSSNATDVARLQSFDFKADYKGPDGSRGDISGIYTKVAPAVVYITQADGAVGSGVLESHDGWILTNAHMVESAFSEGKTHYVHVQMGQMGQMSTMALKKRIYKGYVHKVDEVRDLALIKINGVSRLPFVSLASQNPIPGQEVACLGHAGVGMLWQIKDGTVAAVGKFSDIQKFKGYGGDSVAKRKFYLVQSTCPIGPGDSGGPIVNMQGQLIGLNSFGVPALKGGATGRYHVHIKEIKQFAKAVSAEPKTFAPASASASMKSAGPTFVDAFDLDSDGSYDCLTVAYPPVRGKDGKLIRVGVFYLDLDQDMTGKKSKKQIASDFYAGRYDPEAAVWLWENGAVEVSYDIDERPGPDLTVFGFHNRDLNGSGIVVTGIGKPGAAANALVLLGQQALNPRFIAGGRKAEKRFAFFLARILNQYVMADGFWGLDGFPHPLQRFSAAIKKIGPHIHYLKTKLQTAWVVDTSNRIDKGLKRQRDKGEYVPGIELTLDAAIVYYGGFWYSYYDVDGDHKCDLILVGGKDNRGDYVVRWAYRINHQKNQFSPSNSYVGGPLFSGKYIKNSRVRAKVDAAMNSALNKGVLQ